MAIVFHCKCGRPLKASPEAAGKKTKCPGCNAVLTIPGTPAPAAPGAGAGAVAASPTAAIASAHGVVAASEEDPFSLALDWSTLEAPKAAGSSDGESSSSFIKIDAAQADAHHHHDDPPRPEDGSRQYRVLTQKDQGFSKFNPAKLEETLNAHARRGWTLKAAIALDVPAHGGHHDELVLILER